MTMRPFIKPREPAPLPPLDTSGPVLRAFAALVFAIVMVVCAVTFAQYVCGCYRDNDPNLPSTSTPGANGDYPEHLSMHPKDAGAE